MGTTLTGTTPQDTYDSLIKVTDNGPISGTAKYLSDGLGNDSVLALSTARVGIGTTSPNSTFKVTVNSGTNINSFLNGDKLSFSRSSDNVADVVYLSRTNDLGANGTANIQGYDGIQFRTLGPEGVKMTITDAGNVGIGTSAPAQKLDVAGRVNAAGDNYHTFSVASGSAQIRLERTGTSAGVNYLGSDSDGLLILNSGFGTLATFTANGLTFNGDTAAANALDDYEEGTWTMGVSFGGASVGVTYAANTGSYTKIGRQVTVNGYLQLSSKGSSGGAATITGLPFTVKPTDAFYSSVSIWMNLITFATQVQAYAEPNTTSIFLQEITALGTVTSLTDADFANGSNLMVSLTYFV